jgi:hypothetical protein
MGRILFALAMVGSMRPLGDMGTHLTPTFSLKLSSPQNRLSPQEEGQEKQKLK